MTQFAPKTHNTVSIGLNSVELYPLFPQPFPIPEEGAIKCCTGGENDSDNIYIILKSTKTGESDAVKSHISLFKLQKKLSKKACTFLARDDGSGKYPVAVLHYGLLRQLSAEKWVLLRWISPSKIVGAK